MEGDIGDVAELFGDESDLSDGDQGELWDSMVEPAEDLHIRPGAVRGQEQLQDTDQHTLRFHGFFRLLSCAVSCTLRLSPLTRLQTLLEVWKRKFIPCLCATLLTMMIIYINLLNLGKR